MSKGMNASVDQWYMYKIVAEDGTVLYSQRRWGNVKQARFRQRCTDVLLGMALDESLRKLTWEE